MKTIPLQKEISKKFTISKKIFSLKTYNYKILLQLDLFPGKLNKLPSKIAFISKLL